MQEITFKDQSFVMTDCREYDLYIQAGLDGLSFLIHHPVTRAILWVQFCPFNYPGYQLLFRKIRDIISGDEILKQPFAKISILFTDRHFTLVPEAFFSDKLLRHLLPVKHKYGEEPETIVVPVQQMSAFLAFTVEKELYDYLTETFPGAVISHEVNPLIQNLTSGETPVLNFHLHSSWFVAMATGEKGVNFLNTYEYSNEADMIYFMLSVTKLPELTSLPVRISGRTGSNDSLFSFIKKYIPQAGIANYAGTRLTAPENIPFHWLPGIILL